MKIAHFSDTHGLPRKPVPDDADVIVHTGDLCPDHGPDAEYQDDWLRKAGPQWRAWAKGKPFVFMPGNHDFFPDVARVLRQQGVYAYDASFMPVNIGGLRFYGIPDIPWMNGSWNHERTEEDIADRIAGVFDARPDVVVCHCPPYGVLDDPYRETPDYRIGSTAIASVLAYHEHEPKAYLCGHNHGRGGKTAQVRSTIVSNAATKRVVITL